MLFFALRRSESLAINGVIPRVVCGYLTLPKIFKVGYLVKKKKSSSFE